MDNDATLDALKSENEDLRIVIKERNRDLLEALSALSSMWNQYCPPPRMLMCMSAGEEAEEVLQKWHLMLEDETSIYIDGALLDDNISQKVLDLVGILPLPPQ